MKAFALIAVLLARIEWANFATGKVSTAFVLPDKGYTHLNALPDGRIVAVKATGEALVLDLREKVNAK